MLEGKMRLLILLIAPIFLYACATQQTSEGTPELETDSQMQCARDCELIHAGSVRGCSRMRPGTARDGLADKACIDETYTTLRNCYRSCE